MYKRILVLAPAVWLIASVVFLLSKSMPGSAADYQFEQAGQDPNSMAKAETRQLAYRQLLKRTGQDLPLFYFSLGTVAGPDTLHKIFPETDRKFLESQLRQYGNWQTVSDFYLAVLALQNQISTSQEISKATAAETLAQSGQFLTQTNTGLMVQLPGKLRSESKKQNAEALIPAINEVEVKLKKMAATSPGIKSFLPALYWYGLTNQYHIWLARLFKGDMGISSRDAQPVLNLVSEAFKLTFLIAIVTLFLTGGLAILIGLFLSRKAIVSIRPLVLGALYVIDGFPLFVVALLFLILSGNIFVGADTIDFLNLLPVISCLIVVNLPYLTGQFFSSLQQVLKQDYILAGRAKGLSENRILWSHALRNSILPVITLLSDFFPALLAGTVVLEVIFSLPGMGRLLADSVLARDYNVIIGIVLVIGTLKIVSHLLADLAYKAADPRIRI